MISATAWAAVPAGVLSRAPKPRPRYDGPMASAATYCALPTRTATAMGRRPVPVRPSPASRHSGGINGRCQRSHQIGTLSTRAR